ncbi:MAG: KH domain-containing protein [Atopobiaceae bacterium]|jgi:predicted RNA-binding protein YlqC (UPF0109 family)|nr:KH domain-containing protein [Atopobiaceae bacterium]
MADGIAADDSAVEEAADAQEELSDDEGFASDKIADLVEYIVCGLVSDQDAVSLDVTDREDGSLIEVSCAPQDAGRVIGKRGRTIKAIRTLARALASRIGTSVEVEVAD